MFTDFFMALKYGNEEEAISFYHRWVSQILATVPKEKLLVFRSKEGWIPLCVHLQISKIPKEPFPRVNDTKHMRDMFRKSEMFCNFCYYGLLPSLFCAGVALVKYQY